MGFLNPKSMLKKISGKVAKAPGVGSIVGKLGGGSGGGVAGGVGGGGFFGGALAQLANRRKKATGPVAKPRQAIAPTPITPARGGITLGGRKKAWGYKSKRRGFKG